MQAELTRFTLHTETLDFRVSLVSTDQPPVPLSPPRAHEGTAEYVDIRQVSVGLGQSWVWACLGLRSGDVYLTVIQSRWTRVCS